MPVAVMVAPAVGGTGGYKLWRAHNAGGCDGGTRCRWGGRVQAGGGHIMPMAVMLAPAVSGTGGYKPVADT